MLYFCTGFKKGSCGRVARQSSAKAPTAVRIRSGPPSPSEAFAQEGLSSEAFAQEGSPSEV